MGGARRPADSSGGRTPMLGADIRVARNTGGQRAGDVHETAGHEVPAVAPSLLRRPRLTPFDPAQHAGAEGRAPSRQRGRALRTRGDGGYRGAVLFALVLCAVVAATWLASAPILDGASRALAWAAAHNDPRGRGVFTVICVGLALLGGVVAWGRASSPRRPVRLADGRGRMAMDEIAGRLEDVILERPEIRSARVVVTNRHRRGLRVEARLGVSPETRIDATITAFEAATEALLHRDLVTPMESRPRVDVRYDELDLRRGPLRADTPD